MKNWIVLACAFDKEELTLLRMSLNEFVRKNELSEKGDNVAKSLGDGLEQAHKLLVELEHR